MIKLNGKKLTVEDWENFVCVMPRHAGYSKFVDLCNGAANEEEKVDLEMSIKGITEKQAEDIQEVVDLYMHDYISGNIFRTRRDDVDALAYALPTILSKDDRSKNKPTEADWDEWKSKLPKDAFKAVRRWTRSFLMKFDNSCAAYHPDATVAKSAMHACFRSLMSQLKEKGYIMLYDFEDYFKCDFEGSENVKVRDFSWLSSPVPGPFDIRVTVTIDEDSDGCLYRIADDVGGLDNRMDELAKSLIMRAHDKMETEINRLANIHSTVDECFDDYKHSVLSSILRKTVNDVLKDDDGLDNRMDELEDDVEDLASDIGRMDIEFKAVRSRLNDHSAIISTLEKAHYNSMDKIHGDMEKMLTLVKNNDREQGLQKTEIQNLLDRMCEMEKRAKEAEHRIDILTNECSIMHEAIKFDHGTLVNILDINEKLIRDIEELRARVTKLEADKEDDGK